MANTPQGFGTPRTADMSVDAGLRSYMLGIYNYMAGGIALTGLVAYLVFTLSIAADGTQAAAVLPNGVALSEFGRTLFISPLKWLFMLAPLAFVMFLSFGINRMSVGTAQMLFWAFAAAMGLSMGSIFLVYTMTSISQIFFVTAAAFGGLSLYGYTTKRDLTPFRSFLVMGVWGLMFALIANIFIQSSAFLMALSVIGVLVFAGLTAYETQALKESYYENMGREAAGKLSILGALSLYLNFINMFQFLLILFGDRR